MYGLMCNSKAEGVAPVMVLSRSDNMAPNCGKHGGQIDDDILWADMLTSVLECSAMT